MTNWRDPASIAQEHARRVKRVKAILGPACNEASANAAVNIMIVREARKARRPDYLDKPTNKQEKAALARVGRELRRLESALNNADLPNFVRKLFPPNLRQLQKKLEALGRIRLGKPKRTSRLQREAAMQAAALMQEHKLALKTTRGGKFHRLAAALYGKDNADLFNHCRFCLGVTFD